MPKISSERSEDFIALCAISLKPSPSGLEKYRKLCYNIFDASVNWQKGGGDMLIKKQDCTMDIDIKKTKEYYLTHSLCDCPCCRNYYAQVKQRFQLVDELLSDFGVSIECPDELGSVELQDEIQNIFASYTVCGKILELDKYEIDINDGGLFLNIVIGDYYIPNEQKTDYFVVTIYNINLPWVLNEPFPTSVPYKNSFFNKIKSLFSKK